jgi:hypothetical protein
MFESLLRCFGMVKFNVKDDLNGMLTMCLVKLDIGKY